LWVLDSVPPSSRSASPDQAFSAWLPRELTVAVEEKHHQVYVVSLDFDVVGVGDSMQDAMQDMLGLLTSYLKTYFVEGRSLDEARRPIEPPRQARRFDDLRTALAEFLAPSQEPRVSSVPFPTLNGHPA